MNWTLCIANLSVDGSWFSFEVSREPNVAAAVRISKRSSYGSRGTWSVVSVSIHVHGHDRSLLRSRGHATEAPAATLRRLSQDGRERPDTSRGGAGLGGREGRRETLVWRPEQLWPRQMSSLCVVQRRRSVLFLLLRAIAYRAPLAPSTSAYRCCLPTLGSDCPSHVRTTTTSAAGANGFVVTAPTCVALVPRWRLLPRNGAATIAVGRRGKRLAK